MDNVPPLVSCTARAVDDTNASIQADDIEANLTQDSTVAAVGEELGNPTIHLDGDVVVGNTVNEAEAAEPVEADAVANTTNTADGGANAEVVGGEVQVAVPDGGIAIDALPNGDGNNMVQNIANAEGNTEAAAIEETIEGTTEQNNTAGEEADTLPIQPAGGNGGNYTPQRWTADELHRDDPLLQDTTPADQKLISIYGDTIHQNDGRHLDGGIGFAEDRKWQRLHMRISACQLALYDVPAGRWSARFLQIQTQLLRDVRMRQCNSEKPMIFASCILRKVKNVKRASDVKRLIWDRLDAWEAEKYCALVKGVEEEALVCGFGATDDHEFEVESAGRRYNSMILSGKIRAAVRMVTDQDPGGLFRPDEDWSSRY